MNLKMIKTDGGDIMRGYFYPGIHTFRSFFGMGFGWIGLVLVGVVIFVVIYLLLKRNSRKNDDYYIPKRGETENKALEILNEKFVKGEIDEEEYLRKRKLIEN